MEPNQKLNQAAKLSQTEKPSDERRIDVSVDTDSDGRRHVVVRDMSFASGIGWYPQRTVRLDPSQVDALMSALCSAKQCLAAGGESSCSNGSSSDEPESPKGQVLQMPGLLRS